MAPKKSGGRNAFWYFMVEFQNRQGRKFGSMKDVAEAAGPHWSRMSKQQKQPYEERAKMEKSSRLTSDGRDVDLLESQDRAEQIKIQNMKDDINYNFQLANKDGRLKDELFFIIHINKFCYCTSEDKYYPAEIAVAVFNLIDGVDFDVFHHIVYSGPLPLGYASEAYAQPHGLRPTDANGEVPNNVEEVYFSLKEYLNSKMLGSRRTPVLYTEEKYMKMVQQVLDNWSYEYDGRQDSIFQVYNLQYMFRVLRNTVSGNNVWPTDTFSIREIEKDMFDDVLSLSCDFHQVSPITVNCSRNYVVRRAYTICNNCCSDLGIICRPGYHIPEKSVTRAQLASSFGSSQSSLASSNRNSRRYDDDSSSVLSFSSKSDWDNQSVTSDTNSTFEDDGYPPISGRKNKPSGWRNFSSIDASNTSSQTSSIRSYAGATGTSGLSRRPADMPSSVINGMEKLSVDSSKSDFCASGPEKSKDFNLEDDFPVFGRGKARGRGTPTGFIGRGRPLRH